METLTLHRTSLVRPVAFYRDASQRHASAMSDPQWPLPISIPIMDLSKQRHFRPAALMHAVSDDRQIYLEMCDLFLRTVPELRSALCAAAGRHDTEAVRRQAHSLRGSCLVVGAVELAQWLQEAERAGVKGNVVQMAARVEQVALALDGLLAEIQSALTPAAGPGS